MGIQHKKIFSAERVRERDSYSIQFNIYGEYTNKPYNWIQSASRACEGTNIYTCGGGEIYGPPEIPGAEIRGSPEYRCASESDLESNPIRY